MREAKNRSDEASKKWNPLAAFARRTCVMLVNCDCMGLPSYAIPGSVSALAGLSRWRQSADKYRPVPVFVSLLPAHQDGYVGLSEAHEASISLASLTLEVCAALLFRGSTCHLFC